MGVPADALELLAAQHGVVGRRQLLATGIARSRIDAMLRCGHLLRDTCGVYRLPGVPNGRRQQAMSAVFRCRGQARISGLLVLALLGCEQYEIEESGFVLLVPPSRRLLNVEFDWRPDPAPDLHRAHVDGVPAVTPARAILELAVDLESDEALLLAADRCRWRMGTTAKVLAELVAQVPDHPGTARLEGLGLLDDGRPESPGERDLEAELDPLPFEIEWQVWVAPDLRVDGLIRDVNIVLERDGGAFHADTRDRERDAERQARLEQLGYLVVRITAADLRHPEALRTRLLQLRAARLATMGTPA